MKLGEAVIFEQNCDDGELDNVDVQINVWKTESDFKDLFENSDID